MYKLEDLYIGNILSSRRYGDFEILELNGSRYNKIKFITTGKVYLKQKSAILSGEVADPYYPRVCGVGWLGVGRWKSKNNGVSTRHYKAWRAMLSRCYSPVYHARLRYDQTVDSVSEDWFDFQNFADWYQEELESLPDGIYELDKDLKMGNIYSKENCILIPHRLNTALVLNTSKTDNVCPLGVRKTKDSSKFLAVVSISGLKVNNSSNKNHRYLSGFDTVEEAHEAYLRLKSRYLLDLTNECIEDGTFKKENLPLIENFIKTKLLQEEI